MNCKGCGNDVIDDGHGELIHDTGANGAFYGCEPRKKGQDYPVAS